MKMKSAILGCVVLAIGLGCANAITLERDVIALKLLREEVKGRDSYWNGVMESWTDDTDPCGDSWLGNWKGVECRFQGDVPKDKPRVVTNLHLPDFQLGGPVPLGITLLKDLIELDLDGNNLSGPMNPYIGCLSNMRELDIANNSLTGNIPTEWRFLTKVEEAEIHGNPGLTGCVPQGLPPTTTVCRDDTSTGVVQPICELIGTIVTDTGIQGFCPTIPNIEKRCPDPAFVQQFIDGGRNYALYFQSQADSSMAGEIPVRAEPDPIVAEPEPVVDTTSIFGPQVVSPFTTGGSQVFYIGKKK